SLSSGQAYAAVLVEQGQQVLFVESDASGNGAIGTLQRSANTCIANNNVQSFGFAYYGATPASSTSSTGGSTSGNGSSANGNGNGSSSNGNGSSSNGNGTSAPGTGSSTSSNMLQAYSTVGEITLNGQGTFTATAYTFAGGALQTQTASGTYNV